MKFIYITCNVSMLETLTLLLDEMEYADYQVIEQVTAMSRWGEPRQNTAVWPGYNSAIIVQEVDPVKAKGLRSEERRVGKECNAGESRHQTNKTPGSRQ